MDSLLVVDSDEEVVDSGPMEAASEGEDQGDSVRGKPKSNRPWKPVKKRYSSMSKVKPLRTSWNQKMKLKQDRKHVMTREKELKDEKKKEKEDARQRVVERKKREEENAKRAEIVQPIRNTAKIRRMKRKQLRMVEKR